MKLSIYGTYSYVETSTNTLDKFIRLQALAVVVSLFRMKMATALLERQQIGKQSLYVDEFM